MVSEKKLNSGSRPQQGRAAGGGTKKKVSKRSSVKYTPEQIRRNRVIALLVVVLAIVGMVFLIRWTVDLFGKWQTAQVAEAKAYQLRMEERVFPAPKPCDVQDLQVKLVQDVPLINVGAGMDVTMQVRSGAKAACTTVIDPREVGWEIRSGNQIIYDSTACQPEKVSTKRLLLDKETGWEQRLHWDGFVQNTDCSSAGQVASAGTYRFVPIWRGGPVGAESVFVLQNPPSPAEQNSAENSL